MADPKPDQQAQLKLVKPKDVQQVILQPSVRTSVNWTPARIRAVQRSADGGHLSSAADLCDVILSDDRVKAGFGSRTASLLGLPEEFEPVDPGGEAAAEALEEDWSKAFPDDESGQILKWGAMLGAAPYYHTWKTLLNGRIVPGIKFWHPRHLHFNWSTRQWMVTTQDEGQIPIEPGDGKWGIYCPYGTNRPWAEGLWRGLALWWLVKQFARDDWARYGEAAATRVVESPADSATSMQDNRKQVAAELESMGADGSIALPPGFSVKILEAKADTAKIYQEQIRMANMAFDIAIKGQNLTTEVSTGGSRSSGEVHERVEQRVVRWDGERYSATLREQSTVWWAEFNFGDARLAPEQSWDTEPAEDINDRADRFKTVAEGIAALKGAGFEVDPDQIEEDFELRLTRVEPSAGLPNPGAGPVDANARATIAASEAYARSDGDSSGTADGLPMPRLPAESSEHDEDDDALAQTAVQTLIFTKPRFTVATAKSWAKRHDFSNDKIDETDASVRLRQRPPSDFKPDSFRTITLAMGVQAVIGRLKDSVARAASGYHAQTQGFLDGQEYTDRLIGFGRRLTPEMHANFVGRLINLIDDHDNLEDLKAAAVLLFQDELPPEELAALMENLFVLGELAGMQAVNEDT